ncbi:MAG: hypothetical protein RLP14_09010, partial [Owenweeksia sp.]
MKFFFLGVGLIVSHALVAQNDSIAWGEDSLTWAQQMEHYFGLLDNTDITTGYLKERAFTYYDPAFFNGITEKDTLPHGGCLHSLYDFISTASIDENYLLDSWASWTESSEFTANSELILPVVHFEYNAFINDSLDLWERIYLDEDNHFRDVEEREASPYLVKELFAVGPVNNVVYDTLSITLTINEDYIFSNLEKTIDRIELDASDGQGLQEIHLDEHVNVTWQDYGNKIIYVKITYADESVYEAYSLIELIYTGPPYEKGKVKDATEGYDQFRDDHEHISSGRSQNYGAMLEIEYGCAGGNKIRKPFIIIEGFNSPQLDGGDRGLTYRNFFNDFFVDYLGSFPGPFAIVEELQNEGYDLIYIDFDTPVGDLRENAYVVSAAIDWINEQKILNGSNEPNILLGLSMGGVIGRYALTEMESLSPGTHDVRYYISFDSPHLGANVPLGMQSMADHLYLSCVHTIAGSICIEEYEPRLKGAYEAVHSIGAQQLLRYTTVNLSPNLLDHGGTRIATTPTNILFTQFFNDLQQRGMPQETELNIGVSNGSDNGNDQGFSASSMLIQASCTGSYSGCHYTTNTPFMVNDRLWTGINLKYEFRIKAAPPYGSSSTEVYHGKIWHNPAGFLPPLYAAKPYTYKVKNVYPYDNAPGGEYNYEDFGLDPAELPFKSVTIYNNNFGFIPTVSALNITSEINNPHYVADEQDVINQAKTNFDAVHLLNPPAYPMAVAPPINEPHIHLTPSNIDVFTTFLFNDVDGPEGVGTLNQVTYNYGRYEDPNSNATQKTTDRVTDLITITGSSSVPGKLLINGNGSIGLSTDPNPSNNTSQFGVVLAVSCDANVGILDIGANGVVEVGAGATKTGTLTALEGTRISVNNGGKLVIKEGSRLIIDDGAELRFFDGATVEIATNAEVVIKGKMAVGSNTQFTFTGTGKLVFDQDMWRLDGSGNPFRDYDEYWDIGTNAEFVIEGTQVFSDVIMETKREFIPQMESGRTFSKIEFKRGKVLIGEDAPIHVYNSLTLLNVEFNTANAGLKHAGLR